MIDCQMSGILQSPAFDKHVQSLMKQWRIPGLAIALAHRDDISSKGFGLAGIHPRKPCTPDTLFDIASSSKSLTAASIALLVNNPEKAEEKLQWNAVMSALLPDDFVLNDQIYTNEVTLEDILSHRSGLPRHDFSYLGRRSKNPDTAASVTRNLRNLSLNAPVRTKYQYNNMMFTVATHLIEERTGMTFAHFLQNRFFAPLGMASSFLHPSAAIRAGQEDRLATPYAYHPSSNTLTALPFPEDPEAQGAGGICTSVNDYIIYVQALMKKKFPFTEQIIKDLTTPRVMSEIDDLFPFDSWHAYCLGWRSYYHRGHQVMLHFGGISGFASLHFFLPTFAFGGVMMGNLPEAFVMQEILMRELIDQVVAVPRVERLDWSALLERQMRKRLEAESRTRADLRKNLLDGRHSPEQQTNPLKEYLGVYENAGYHTLRVEVRGNRLFIDATDRSMGFTLVFEHIHSQRVYLVRGTARDNQEDFDELAGIFCFKDDKEIGTASRLGLRLEPSLDDMIWFDRCSDEEMVSQYRTQ